MKTNHKLLSLKGTQFIAADILLDGLIEKELADPEQYLNTAVAISTVAGEMICISMDQMHLKYGAMLIRAAQLKHELDLLKASIKEGQQTISE